MFNLTMVRAKRNINQGFVLIFWTASVMHYYSAEF